MVAGASVGEDVSGWSAGVAVAVVGEEAPSPFNELFLSPLAVDNTPHAPAALLGCVGVVVVVVAAASSPLPPPLPAPLPPPPGPSAANLDFAGTTGRPKTSCFLADDAGAVTVFFIIMSPRRPTFPTLGNRARGSDGSKTRHTFDRAPPPIGRSRSLALATTRRW